MDRKEIIKENIDQDLAFNYKYRACYNYERLQALGIADLMITPIRALYDKVEDQVAELKKYPCIL